MAPGHSSMAEERSDAATSPGDPADAQATRLFAEATAHFEARRYAEADECARQALAHRLDDPQIWNARGVFLRSDRKIDAAIACYRQALELAPDHAGAWSNLGNALKDAKHVELALACHRRAIALAPRNADFPFNLAIALTAGGRHREALDAFNDALALRPTDAKFRWNRGLAHLHLGDLARGWPDYDARIDTGQLPKRELPGRRWRGESYAGQSLFIAAEQGFGDALWAARYLAAAKSRGGELILECRPELIPLMEAVGIADRIVPRYTAFPGAAWHCYQNSLPGIFTPSFAAIPPAPYLAAPPARRSKFDAVIERAQQRLKVGIVWSGSTTFATNHDRAVPLTRFLRAFSLPGVQLYSLQKGPRAAELTALSDASIIDLDPLIDDFADTAAALACLDLVIITDSAVGHLAGALGRPVWLLLNHVPYWLWSTERTDSPWYPSMRLFRPRCWGDWDGVFDAAGAALLALTRKDGVTG
jgi:Flp pilus assembly protein TadD